MPRKTGDEFLKAEAYRLHNEGRTIRDIADEFNVAKSTVGKWLKDISRATEQDTQREVPSYPVEVVADPADILKQHQELLEQHLVISEDIQQLLLDSQGGAVAQWREMESFLKVSIDDLEAAVDAEIRYVDSDGVAYSEPPDDWTKFKRRVAIGRDLIGIHQAKISLLNTITRTAGSTIALQRQATGLEYCQELSSAMARILAAGYSISR